MVVSHRSRQAVRGRRPTAIPILGGLPALSASVPEVPAAASTRYGAFSHSRARHLRMTWRSPGRERSCSMHRRRRAIPTSSSSCRINSRSRPRTGRKESILSPRSSRADGCERRIARSTDAVPYHTHADPQPLAPGEIYKFEISLEPMAYLVRAGHRLRLEIVNGDSPVSEQLWVHYYRPDKIGADTIHHDPAHPSALILPVAAADA